jgi:hypothetical protein
VVVIVAILAVLVVGAIIVVVMKKNQQSKAVPQAGVYAAPAPDSARGEQREVFSNPVYNE